MSEMTLPPLETAPAEAHDSDWETVDAPWGYKADGTPRKKPGRPSGSTNSGKSVGKSDAAFASRIQDELIELSAPLAIVSPLATWHVAERAERTSRALVIISKKHPAVKLAIETYFDSIAYKDLAMFVLGIPVAIMIDIGMLKPNAMVGKAWRMEDGYNEIYEHDSESAQNGSMATARGLAGEI